MPSSEVSAQRKCGFAPTDILGVAASDKLDTHGISYIQNAVIEGALTTRKDAMAANLPSV